MDLTATWNAEYIDAQYERWKTAPDELSQDWRFFFEGFELASSGAPEAAESYNEEQHSWWAVISTCVSHNAGVGKEQ